MGDSDRTLEILIKLGYVGKEQADQARKDLADFNEGSGDLTKTLEKEGESTNTLTGLHRELRSAMMAVTQQSPILGSALGSIFLGPVGAIIGAISTFP